MSLLLGTNKPSLRCCVWCTVLYIDMDTLLSHVGGIFRRECAYVGTRQLGYFFVLVLGPGRLNQVALIQKWQLNLSTITPINCPFLRPPYPHKAF